MSFASADVSRTDFARAMHERGWVTFDNVLSPDTVALLGAALVAAQAKCAEYQIRNMVEANTDGTSHHVLLHDKVFLDLLESAPLHDYLEEHFEGRYILHSYGGVINVKNKRPYVCNVHRDVKFNTRGLNVIVNMLIMLDDFTLDNGATYLLSGSQLRAEKPADDLFFAQADRAVGRKGSIVLFDSNVWHCAGINNTDAERKALTLTFARPCIKPLLDFPRAMGYELGPTFTPHLRQVLGYNARVPSNLDEWYQPREKRIYHADQ